MKNVLNFNAFMAGFFPTKDELQKHIKMLEEAAKRDHRKLGRELELFMMHEEVGAGLHVATKRGYFSRGN